MTWRTLFRSKTTSRTFLGGGNHPLALVLPVSISSSVRALSIRIARQCPHLVLVLDWEPLWGMHAYSPVQCLPPPAAGTGDLGNRPLSGAVLCAES